MFDVLTKIVVMRIARVDVVAARVSPPPEQAALRALQGEWVFVVVSTEGGVTGYGEATHSGDDGGLASLVRHHIAPYLHQHSTLLNEPRRSLSCWTRACFGLGPDRCLRDRVAATAVSAVEQALWDVAARAAGLPLYRTLGRQSADPPPAVPLYATLNRGIFDRSPEGFAAAARRATADGFRAIKCAPFDGVAHGGPPSAERDAAIGVGMERVAAVRPAIGPRVDLMVDCHTRFGEVEAIAVARRLEPLRLRWLEEPAPFAPAPAPLARVRRAVSLPIANGALHLSGRPGLGIALDERTLAAHAHPL